MYRCLALAKMGAGNVAPNPMVGAVLVYKNKIIGEGYHQQYGQAHAEVNCINNVAKIDKHLIEQSTLYVSLEPCVHFGKTPPCVDLIIKNKINKVVIACSDNYEDVNGKGIKKLKAAGVHVTVGVLEMQARELNKQFFSFHQLQRPYIILKWAQSVDRKIAGTDDKKVFISNPFTNRLVHQWRSQEASIMIGTNTALKDNPLLTTRLFFGKNPLRIVVDLDLKLPLSLHLFNSNAKTIVFNYHKQIDDAVISFYKINKNKKILPQILHALFKLNIQSIIVEGGAKLLQSFIVDNLWDEARIITNTQMKIIDGIAAPNFAAKKMVTKENILTDTIEYFINPHKA